MIWKPKGDALSAISRPIYGGLRIGKGVSMLAVPLNSIDAVLI